MKILPVGAELFLADGRTEGQTDRHDEAKRWFSKFCERAQNVQIAKRMQHLLRMQGTRNPMLVHE
jgi:hypothetical protein